MLFSGSVVLLEETEEFLSLDLSFLILGLLLQWCCNSGAFEDTDREWWANDLCVCSRSVASTRVAKNEKFIHDVHVDNVHDVHKWCLEDILNVLTFDYSVMAHHQLIIVKLVVFCLFFFLIQGFSIISNYFSHCKWFLINNLIALLLLAHYKCKINIDTKR